MQCFLLSLSATNHLSCCFFECSCLYEVCPPLRPSSITVPGQQPDSWGGRVGWDSWVKRSLSLGLVTFNSKHTELWKDLFHIKSKIKMRMTLMLLTSLHQFQSAFWIHSTETVFSSGKHKRPECQKGRKTQKRTDEECDLSLLVLQLHRVEAPLTPARKEMSQKHCGKINCPSRVLECPGGNHGNEPRPRHAFANFLHKEEWCTVWGKEKSLWWSYLSLFNGE